MALALGATMLLVGDGIMGTWRPRRRPCWFLRLPSVAAARLDRSRDSYLLTDSDEGAERLAHVYTVFGSHA